MLSDYFIKEQCNPTPRTMPQPDERYSRDARKDFLTALDKWFEFAEGIKNSNLHPEAFYSLMRFIKADLNTVC